MLPDFYFYQALTQPCPSSTSAKGYKDFRMLKFIYLKREFCLFVGDSLISLLCPVVKMPCASEHESDVTRDQICIYKALVGYHFHLLPDSSLSCKYVLLDEYANTIHIPICICGKLGSYFCQSKTWGQNQISQCLVSNTTIYPQGHIKHHDCHG